LIFLKILFAAGEQSDRVSQGIKGVKN
jgi:hypothetical protein